MISSAAVQLTCAYLSVTCSAVCVLACYTVQTSSQAWMSEKSRGLKDYICVKSKQMERTKVVMTAEALDENSDSNDEV